MATVASFRLFRTGLTASLIFALGVGGHLAGGGLLPDPVILVALCVLVLVPVVALTRARLSFPVLTALLGVGQAWLHWSFEAFAAGPVPAPAQVLPPLSHSGHVPVLGADIPANTVLSSHDVGGGWSMFIAHAVATLATAVLLARGEEALRLMAAWLQPLVRFPEPFVLPSAIHPAWPADNAVLPAAPALGLPSRRGPPAVILAA
jgi:hypothetical protein